MFLMGDFLAVGIIKNHANTLPRQQLIIVVLLLHPQANALILNRLAGPIDSAISEENGLRVLCPVLWQIGIELILRSQFLAMMARAQEITALLRGRETEEAILIRRDLRLRNAI